MAINPAPSSHIPDGLNFLFPNFESKFRNPTMLFDKTLIELNILLDSIKCFVMKENDIFFNFNTDSRINLCASAQYLRYVEDNHQGYRLTLSDF